NGDMTFRTIVEPNPQVYKGIGEEALASLQKNYASLKERGCLHKVGVFGGVAEASEIKLHCLQGSFVTKVLPPTFVLLLVLFEALIAGRVVLRRIIRLLPVQPFSEFVISLAIGLSSIIVVLWTAALLGVYTALFGWLLAMVIPILGYKDAQYWLTKFMRSAWHIDVKWNSLTLFLTWFLLSYLAFNYINVIRPFPIGWDDLGSYLNRPRLLVSYGKFVHSMASFQWEYLTSLGFLLFGFDSVFGATTSLVINWVEGVLAILIVLLFGRTFIGDKHGVLSAALYYTLPLVGHFSFADMKIDNAVFSMGALGTFAVFYALFKEQDRRTGLRWILLGGIFLGMAFSMKITAIMVFMALGAVIAGVSLHWSAFSAAFFLICALYVKQGTINIPKIFDRVNYSADIASPFIVFVFFAVLGVVLLGVACVLRKDRIKESCIAICMFVAGFGVVIYPWIQHNSLLQGSLVPRPSHLTAPNTLTPRMNIFGDATGQTDYALPPELAVSHDSENCRASAGAEELDRYWGNAVGWGHYLTLPWRTVMNIDHVGYYVTPQPIVLLFPLLLLLPFFWKSGGRWARWMWLSTLFLVAQWTFLANGVVWYGIGMFLGLVLCAELLVANAPDIINRTVVVSLAIFSLLLCLGFRFWQYDTQRNLFEYVIGKVSAETMQERTIPYYDDITDIVLERYSSMPDRPLLYRIGTFIPYFIPRNLEVIGITDHQLDTFNCLYQDFDNAKTLERLKALGFNSILFDTNTATIERDQNGSLHQKVNKLVQFINSKEANLQMVINDPGAGIVFLLIP
ncbi:MAG: hypothetical protein KC680_01400, partial [Candidatus Peregrinibacteria bacterium]|nr:hypothetical protein [Candidatus Peregrinibacteria bacterium]